MHIFAFKESERKALTFGLLYLVLFGCSTAATKDDLFVYDDRKYAAGDLPPNVQHQIYTVESDRQARLKDILKAAILDMYFKEKAAEKKTTIEAVKKEYFTLGEPTEKEKRAFLEKNKAIIPYDYDIVKGELGSLMADSRRAEAEDRVLREVEKTKGARYLFSLPEPVPLKLNLADFPSKGPSDAKVVIAEFADFTCPVCRATAYPLKALLKKYEGKVRLVYKYYLIHEGGSSERMAKAGYCAHKQGKFWPYYDYAFDKETDARWKSLDDIAKAVGLGAKAFNACNASKEAADAITASQGEGLDLGVTKTPTFFVNGRLTSVGADLAPLEEAIKKAL